jgi:hypothetical protein
MYPLPTTFVVNEYSLSTKCAVTDLAALMLTVQVPVPEHPSPDQPVKVEPVEATAVRVTEVL